MPKAAEPTLIVGLSGRALAASAAKAGYPVVVLDMFNDMDTRRHALASARAAGALSTGFKPRALLKSAERLAPKPAAVTYTSGFDLRTGLLSRLASGRRLLGNPAAVVRRVKDPVMFFGMLERLDAPYPQTRISPPADPRGWLVKRIGGAGGGHIRPAEGACPSRNSYYQRWIEGRPVSALFLADGRDARILGFSEQWSAPKPEGGGYRYGGAAFPAAIPPELQPIIARLLSQITAETGLVGANSADMLIDGRGFSLLEVNPRPGATIDAYDRSFDSSLFDLHMRACNGSLPMVRNMAACACATAIVYADREYLMPPTAFWPEWSADIPVQGLLIRHSEPICTVSAGGVGLADARDKAVARVDEILTELKHGFCIGGEVKSSGVYGESWKYQQQEYNGYE